MVDVCYPDGTDWSCALTPEEIADLDPARKARAEALAWSTLSSLLGYRLALCPTVLRPCAKACAPGTWYVAPVTGGYGTAFSPYLSDGRWYNGCGCTSDCSCGTLSQVILPTPSGGVKEVWLDGVLLDASAYRVDNGNSLVRTDGGVWPTCQDMSAPLTVNVYEPIVGTYGTTGSYEMVRTGNRVTVTVMPDVTEGIVGTVLPEFFQPTVYEVEAENPSATVRIQAHPGEARILLTRHLPEPAESLTFEYLAVPAEAEIVGVAGTFGVVYYPFLAPNDLLRFAAGVLANEYYKSCGGQKCRLPNGVTNITRNGISMELPTGLFPNGGTGLPEVDPIIRIYNPNGLKMPPRAMSPDYGRGRVQTG